MNTGVGVDIQSFVFAPEIICKCYESSSRFEGNWASFC